MKFSIDLLAKSVLQKDTLEQCSNHELQQLIDQYPYFGAAHLLLAKKMFSENSDNFNEQLQKASLFFNNPLWLEYLLNDTGNAGFTQASPSFEAKERTHSLIEELEKLKLDIPGKKEQAIIEQPAIINEQSDIIAEEPEIKSEPEEEYVEENNDIRVELPAFKFKPIDPGNSKLVFEPYHTVDYFASLGIKFKEEILPEDKFGKQLKSFTEWLKTLKKLPETTISQTREPFNEQKVEELADQSIKDRDILTEAMADVWEKQGNKEKAIEIYNKLSLLNASKRPYFAAKIEELKKIN